MTKILFAYDGSDESRRALRYASRLCERDDIIVLSVATKLIEAPSTAQFTEPGHGLENVQAGLEDVREIISDAGVNAEFISTIGNPAAEILNTAETRDIELIVLGRRGLHTVERFLMGSVADRVVQHATCDVLVVK
jgi:nucleotide-binding universal stress UspA family protein